MKRAVWYIVFAAVVSSTILALAQSNVAASDAELAATTARGRMLYEYDQAAWHAGDAVRAAHPPDERHRRYIAQKRGSVWVVAFGHLNDSKDAFLITVMATQGSTPQEFSVKILDAPQPDTGFFLAAAKAADLAAAEFRGENVPYNAEILPAPNGQFYVYVIPAQVKPDEYPLGADARFLVAPDGSAIVETRQMHKSLIANRGALPPGATMVAGNHTHILSDVPEDSDVFYVLTRKPSLPEYIGTQGAIYEVRADGTIRVVQKMKKHK